MSSDSKSNVLINWLSDMWKQTVQGFSSTAHSGISVIGGFFQLFDIKQLFGFNVDTLEAKATGLVKSSENAALSAAEAAKKAAGIKTDTIAGGETVADAGAPGNSPTNKQPGVRVKS